MLKCIWKLFWTIYKKKNCFLFKSSMLHIFLLPYTVGSTWLDTSLQVWSEKMKTFTLKSIPVLSEMTSTLLQCFPIRSCSTGTYKAFFSLCGVACNSMVISEPFNNNSFVSTCGNVALNIKHNTSLIKREFSWHSFTSLTRSNIYFAVYL